MACGCLDKINERLAEANSRVVTTIFRDPDVPLIQTEKIETRKRGGPMGALASYCPWCGTAYQSRDLVAECFGKDKAA